jgi:hypothetical protein
MTQIRERYRPLYRLRKALSAFVAPVVLVGANKLTKTAYPFPLFFVVRCRRALEEMRRVLSITELYSGKEIVEEIKKRSPRGFFSRAPIEDSRDRIRECVTATLKITPPKIKSAPREASQGVTANGVRKLGFDDPQFEEDLTSRCGSSFEEIVEES